MDFDEQSSNTQKIDQSQEGYGDLDDLMFLEKDFDEQDLFPTKDLIIFLIDCSPSMFKEILDKSSQKITTPISTLLKVTENLLSGLNNITEESDNKVNLRDTIN